MFYFVDVYRCEGNFFSGFFFLEFVLFLRIWVIWGFGSGLSGILLVEWGFCIVLEIFNLVKNLFIG